MADPSYIVDNVLTDGEAWVALASTTLGSDTAEVTFTSPDDGSSLDWSQFMDLILILYGRSTESAAASYGRVYLNNDSTGTNFPWQTFYGNGSAATAGTGTGYGYIQAGYFPAATAGANIFGATVVHLFDINSGKYKTIVSLSAADTDGSGHVSLDQTLWKSQAPITEIDIKLNNADNILAASRFDLFGVLPRMVA